MAQGYLVRQLRPNGQELFLEGLENLVKTTYWTTAPTEALVFARAADAQLICQEYQHGWDNLTVVWIDTKGEISDGKVQRT